MAVKFPPTGPMTIERLAESTPTKQEQQIQELQDDLAAERDARREERFVFVVVSVILLNVVFFSVIPTLTGPLGLVVLELLILVPLARRMGLDEVVRIINAVITRMAGKAAE
jgi:hypothetical protein